MKYFVALTVEVEDRNSEVDVRRAVESVAEQAQSGWFGLTGDPKVTVRTVKIAETATRPAPAAAVTFPSLTTIYVGSGIRDNFTGQGPRVGTAFNCSNVSGVAATVRFLVLNLDGQLVRSASISVPHGGTRTAVTRLVATFLEDLNLETGSVAQGVVNIESTQSAVFCNAMIVDTAVAGQGINIPLVRVNAHPGTVE